MIMHVISNLHALGISSSTFLLRAYIWRLAVATKYDRLNAVSFARMADVRALLRAERTVRCVEPVKKRKAVDRETPQMKRLRLDEDSSDNHKDSPSNAKDHIVPTNLYAEHDSEYSIHPEQIDQSKDVTSTLGELDHSTVTAIDEAEWAAFEKDVATPALEVPLSAFTAPATIQAPAWNAFELNDKTTGDQQSIKDQRHAEVEAEKEDASRQLDEEFEQMEALEQRVRQLRNRREALRSVRFVHRSGPIESLNSPFDEHLSKGLSGSSNPVIDEELSDDANEFDLWHIRHP